VGGDMVEEMLIIVSVLRNGLIIKCWLAGGACNVLLCDGKNQKHAY